MDKLPNNANPLSVKEADIKLVIRIVNTSEYCSFKAQEIKNAIVDKIDEIYKERIDFDDVSESFQLLINKSLDIPLSLFSHQFSNSMLYIEKTNWLSSFKCQDNSSYVNEIKQNLESGYTPIVKKLSNEYHVYMCKKIAENLINRFVASISKIRTGISDSGAQQLLIDAQSFEKFLLNVLPKIGVDNKRKVPSIYTNHVKNEMGRIISILKCIGYPPSMVEENFRNLLRNGNTKDLIRIMEFKSMKRSEQNTIIDAYQRKVPVSQQMKAVLKKEESIVPNIPLPSIPISNFNNSIMQGLTKFGQYIDKSVNSFQ
jgi:hypothetical protein